MRECKVRSLVGGTTPAAWVDVVDGGTVGVLAAECLVDGLAADGADGGEEGEECRPVLLPPGMCEFPHCLIPLALGEAPGFL